MGICKKKLDEGVTIVFIDESGYKLLPYTNKTWALKGTVPEIVTSGNNRNKLSAISGIAIKGADKKETKLFYRIYIDQTIKGIEVMKFLYQVASQIYGDIIFIMDNLSTHKASKVKSYIKKNQRLQLIYLPPYSPDMNPDEGVWNWSKTKYLVIPNVINSCASI